MPSEEQDKEKKDESVESKAVGARGRIVRDRYVIDHKTTCQKFRSCGSVQCDQAFSIVKHMMVWYGRCRKSHHDSGKSHVEAGPRGTKETIRCFTHGVYKHAPRIRFWVVIGSPEVPKQAAGTFTGSHSPDSRIVYSITGSQISVPLSLWPIYEDVRGLLSNCVMWNASELPYRH